MLILSNKLRYWPISGQHWGIAHSGGTLVTFPFGFSQFCRKLDLNCLFLIIVVPIFLWARDNLLGGQFWATGRLNLLCGQMPNQLTCYLPPCTYQPLRFSIIWKIDKNSMYMYSPYKSASQRSSYFLCSGCSNRNLLTSSPSLHNVLILSQFRIRFMALYLLIWLTFCFMLNLLSNC